MNAFQKKVTLKVLGIHTVIVLLALIVPLMQSCFRPKPKEIITFVHIPDAPPSVSVADVPSLSEPEPVDPEPTPERVPEEVPPPPKTPTPTPKEPTPEPKPEKPKPEKPKWKPTKVDPSKSTRVNESPKTPTIAPADLDKVFKDLNPATSKPASSSEINAYIGRIGAYFRKYWTPPASASSASGVTVVRISMRKSGQITKRVKIQKSGDPLYDKTVMDAVNAVSTVPRPPANYPYDYVEVEFEIRN